MATLTNDITVIEAVLEQCVQRYATPDARMFTVFDRERGHFLVVEEGWNNSKHLYVPFAHIELRDDQIWILQDFTNHGIAHDLIAQGIPSTQIVLGYKAPSLRSFTDMATA